MTRRRGQRMAMTYSRPGHVLRDAAILRSRIGHRGAFLLFLGILDTGIGYGLITAELDKLAGAVGNTFGALARLNTILPLDAWGGLWLGTAVVVIIGAFMRYDRIAYAAASFMKSAWAALYVYLTIVDHYKQGLLAALVWLSFAAVTLIISSWPEGGDTGDGACKTEHEPDPGADRSGGGP